MAIAGDVTSYADVTAAVTTAVHRFGRLDILVNNAGLIDPIARIADSVWISTQPEPHPKTATTVR